MYAPGLTESERGELSGVCSYWLSSLSESALERFGQQIFDAFAAWKRSQIDSDGLISVSAPAGGLLSTAAKTELKRPEDVVPWECAGPYVQDYIGLAFKLWLDNFEPFTSLFPEHGYARVFAIVCAMSWHDATQESLVRLVAFLTSNLMEDARWNAKHADSRIKSNASLPKARLSAARRKREQRAKRDQLAYQMAMEYKRAHPAAGKPQIIAYLRKQAHFDKWKDSTLDRAIRGAMDEALSSLDRKLPR